MRSPIGDKISVCLLTYNHAHLIESTLASILEQTISGYEVIVSDDCSTDGTWELLQNMALRDTRIKAVRTPRNMGMAGNANYAVAQTSRPYIALLHHDDICRPDLLEKWVGLLDRFPEAAFVFNAYGVYQSDYIYREKITKECVEGGWLLEEFLLPQWGCIVRGTAMVRRSAWEKVDGLREQFGLLADIDLWMRLAMRWQVGYVNDPLLAVRQERPEGYPDEYKGSGWSWSRKRFLYEIHATNRLEYYDLTSIRGRLHWWNFRWRLSIETAKWLIYAVVRKKPEMIESSKDSVTKYDLLPLRLFRWALLTIFSIMPASR